MRRELARGTKIGAVVHYRGFRNVAETCTRRSNWCCSAFKGSYCTACHFPFLLQITLGSLNILFHGSHLSVAGRCENIGPWPISAHTVLQWDVQSMHHRLLSIFKGTDTVG